MYSLIVNVMLTQAKSLSQDIEEGTSVLPDSKCYAHPGQVSIPRHRGGY